VEECFNLKENCLGGAGNGSREICFEGHIGALCEVCDIDGTTWGEKWANSANF